MGSPITRLACLLIVIMSAHGGPDPTLDDHWKLWVLQHQKVYMDAMEELNRRMIWEDSLKFVSIHNLEYSLGLHTYEVGMNHLADMTSEEVVATMTGFRAPEVTEFDSTGGLAECDVNPPCSIDWRKKKYVTKVKEQTSEEVVATMTGFRAPKITEFDSTGGLAECDVNPPRSIDWRKKKCVTKVKEQTSEEVVATMTGFWAPEVTEFDSTGGLAEWDVKPPSSIDWRKQKCVTKVKEQKKCNSCWAFSATGSLECQMKLKTGMLQSLSEQQLIDCSGSYGNHGCKHGWTEEAFRYIVDHGIALESSYPYQGKNGTCHSAPIHIRCRSYKTLPSGNERYLQQMVGNKGPVSVVVDASNKSFQMYKRGVYFEPNCRSSDPSHAVLAAGYGTEKKAAYWLVKNSWGTNWGDEGYIKMARNRDNHCGIASLCTFPIV